jgi:DnaJ-class molecular chaperone
MSIEKMPNRPGAERKGENEICPRCNGSGKSEGERCERCRGVGRLPSSR